MKPTKSNRAIWILSAALFVSLGLNLLIYMTFQTRQFMSYVAVLDNSKFYANRTQEIIDAIEKGDMIYANGRLKMVKQSHIQMVEHMQNPELYPEKINYAAVVTLKYIEAGQDLGKLGEEQ